MPKMKDPGEFRWEELRGGPLPNLETPPKTSGSNKTPPQGGPRSHKVGFEGFDWGKGKGHAGSTQEDASDVTWHALGLAKWALKFAQAEVDVDAWVAELNLVKGEFEYSSWHGQVDLMDLIGLEEPVIELEETVFAAAPMAARVADPTMHGGPLGPGTGSSDVLIGGIPAWRATLDTFACPLSTPQPHGGAVATAGEISVLINGFPAARAGDAVVEPGGGPNPIVTGHPSVFIGKPAPKVTCKLPVAKHPMGDDPWINFDLVGTMDYGYGKGEGNVGAEFDGSKGKANLQAKVGGVASFLKGDVVGSMKVKIPGTDHHLTVGLGGEASGLSAGAEGGGKLLFNETDARGKHHLLKADWGGKLGVGLLGGGMKFSLGIS